MKSSPENTLINSKIKAVIDENVLCRKFSRYLHLEEKEHMNIFMGIGFISGKDGLSQGLPIDILNMIMVASQIQEELQRNGKSSIIHLLIADHLACQSNDMEYPNEIKSLALRYHAQILSTLSNLKMADKVVIHYSSDIIQKKIYQDILNKIESLKKEDICQEKMPLVHDVILAQGKYNQGNRRYFVNQTALGEYFYHIHHCVIKISWSRNAKDKDILKSTSFDEPHFDRFYEEKNGRTLSFIYVDAGHDIEHDKCVVPYCAPDSAQMVRVLFDLLEDQKAEELPLKAKSKLATNIAYYYQAMQQQEEKNDQALDLQEMTRSVQTLGALSMTRKKWMEQSVSSDSYLSRLPLKVCQQVDRLLTLGSKPHL